MNALKELGCAFLVIAACIVFVVFMMTLSELTK
jgi:hypothetical protein